MKICVNVGHTLKGAGSGAIGIKNESIENRNVANELISLLKGRGYEVVLSKVDRASSNVAYLKECVDISNNNKCDLFISIHFNSFNKKAYGVECFYYKSNENGKKVANSICESISRIGFKNRGAKDGSNLYVIRNTLCDAVLIECCFIDNDDDMKKYDYKKMARAICDGIIKKDSESEIYRVCVGSFSVKDNAINCLNEAKDKGFDDAFIYC